MRAIEVIRDWGIVDWAVLLSGLDKGWSDKSDVIEYASELLKNRNSNTLVLLAGGEANSASELRKRINNYLEEQGINLGEKDIGEGVNRWKMALLELLSKKQISQEKKIDELQEIYCLFDYPEDLKGCSIYSDDGIDPLEAMTKRLNALKTHFLG